MTRNILIVLLLAGISTSLRAQDIAPFRKGDHVTFVGNSITDGGHYHSYIWLYYMTHFPTMRLWMSNCGVGGDTAHSIWARLDDDVLSRQPTVLTLTFGMNDSGYYEYNGTDPQGFADRQVAQSITNFDSIRRRLTTLQDTRIIMLGTSPYDQTSRFNQDIFHGKNDAMRRIVAYQQATAQAEKWEFLDFNAPMTRINEEQQQTDSTFTLCGTDRIHPDNDGHMVMAYLFLKAQGMAGQKVADVEIDAARRKVLRSENCKITTLRSRDGTVSFDYLARSLPYPMDPVARGWGFSRPQADAVKVIPTLMDDLSNERLTVRGLQGRYELRIDDTLIDTLTAMQLTQGVNLATYTHTPQYQQALTVMALNERRWEIERGLREYAWVQYNFFLGKGMLHQNDAEAEQAMWEAGADNAWLKGYRGMYARLRHAESRQMDERQMKLLVKRIYQINRPVKRHIVLRPVD